MAHHLLPWSPPREKHRCLLFIFEVFRAEPHLELRFFNCFQFHDVDHDEKGRKDEKERDGPEGQAEAEEEDEEAAEHRIADVRVGAGGDQLGGWIEGNGGPLQPHEMQSGPEVQKETEEDDRDRQNGAYRRGKKTGKPE